MKTALRTLAGLAALLLAQAAAGQAFPTRSVTLTVGFAPGGGTDTAARIVAQKLSDNLGQSVVVENKAGAGGNIAAQHIANALPDGYTIHLTSVVFLAVSSASIRTTFPSRIRTSPSLALAGTWLRFILIRLRSGFSQMAYSPSNRSIIIFIHLLPCHQV